MKLRHIGLLFLTTVVSMNVYAEYMNAGGLTMKRLSEVNDSDLRVNVQGDNIGICRIVIRGDDNTVLTRNLLADWASKIKFTSTFDGSSDNSIQPNMTYEGLVFKLNTGSHYVTGITMVTKDGLSIAKSLKSLHPFAVMVGMCHQPPVETPKT